MTTSREDPNRRHWEDVAAGRPSAWQALATEPDGVVAESVVVPPALRLRPPRADPGGVVLAVHGGGFVSGSPATHRRMFGHLARAARAEVVVPEYGLVPAHVFPDQPDAVLRAYRAVAGDGRRVAVVGDSCGALLALGLAVSLRDSGAAPPVGLLLMSAWTDLEATGASFDAGSDPYFTRDLVRSLAAGYLAGADPRDPRVSPLNARMDGLPPVRLQVGAAEALLDDSRRLAARLRAAAVDVRLDEFAGQLHTFQMAVGRSAVADDAIGRAGVWLRSRLVA